MSSRTASPNVGPLVNRDEPVPILKIDQPSPSGTATPNSAYGGDLRRTLSASRLAARLEETGISRNGIQDRLFNSLFSQIFPEHENDQAGDKTKRRPVHHVEKPQFSLPQMSSNFRRFNARIGAIFVFQNRMARLFSWRKPSHTLSFLAVYTFVCLDPSLLVVLPMAVCLLFIMVPAFMSRHPPPPSAALTDPFSTRGPAIAPPPTIKPAPDLSKDFFRNMRDMQNSMEDFVIVHDQLVSKVAPATNFSDEKFSSALFVILFLGGCIMFIVARFIPFRLIFLFGGWFVVGSSHPAVLELRSGVDQKKVQAQQGRAKTEFENWVEGDIILDEEPEKRQVEVFELQRARGSEWEPWLYSVSPFDPLSPARISGDRPHGARFFEDVQAPEGWIWSGKKWSLDLFSREWVEDRMITSVEIETEGERWVYDVERDPTSPSKSRAKKPDWEESFGHERQGEWRRRRWVRVVQRMTLQQRHAAAKEQALRQASPFD